MLNCFLLYTYGSSYSNNDILFCQQSLAGCYNKSMKTEFEAKFTDVDHDEIRKRLKEQGAVLEQPLRIMKRVIIHTAEMTKINAFVRIRDEGHRVVITYKQFDDNTIEGAKEYEIEVSDFDEAVNIFSASGLKYDAYQESKRENWRLKDIEITLDEWPWLNPYIEIEGKSEKDIKEAAKLLGLDWSNTLFGSVADIYKKQYPHIGDGGIEIINHEWSVIKFENPVPEILKE